MARPYCSRGGPVVQSRCLHFGSPEPACPDFTPCSTRALSLAMNERKEHQVVWTQLKRVALPVTEERPETQLVTRLLEFLRK